MKQALTKIIFDLYQVEATVELTRPDQQHGDYTSNVAMQLAKSVGQAPRQIADQIAAEVRQLAGVESVEVAGPGFINLRVDSAWLESSLSRAWTANYGENTVGAGKTAVVEYPSPNMAKPYSVGHLRSGNQGWAAKRLLEATGWTVITDNHLGDYGAPFGMWVVGFLNFSDDERLAKDGIYELGRVYIEVRQALKDEAEQGQTELADQVQQWLIKLEKGDDQAVAYSQRFREISLDHIHNVMRRLQISTDYELGEAFFAPRGKVLVKELLARDLARQNDDGSVIVELDEFGIDTPILIQKSNGAALYATTDLATLRYREDSWQPDRVVYSVGAEQQFYFRQLFALAKKLDIKTDFTHLWFGTIDQKNPDGSREKMSSRKGVVLMEELLDTAEQKARQLVGDRQLNDEDIQAIALGAIKFSDFVADRRTNILFDWQTIFALSGMSGPYIQYAAVRVNKILRDHNSTAFYDDYKFEPEKSLLLKIADYPQVVDSAAADLEPHKIAGYLYELARELNRYYETTRVSDAPENEKAARLSVLAKASHVLTHGLDLLGISVPSQM